MLDTHLRSYTLLGLEKTQSRATSWTTTVAGCCRKARHAPKNDQKRSGGEGGRGEEAAEDSHPRGRPTRPSEKRQQRRRATAHPQHRARPSTASQPNKPLTNLSASMIRSTSDSNLLRCLTRSCKSSRHPGDVPTWSTSFSARSDRHLSCCLALTSAFLARRDKPVSQLCALLWPVRKATRPYS